MGWTAEIMVWQTDALGDTLPMKHVEAKIEGESLVDAKTGAEWVLNSMAAGKLASIRAEPEANEEREFGRQRTRYRGYVRFSFVEHAGKWQVTDATRIPISLGETQEAHHG